MQLGQDLTEALGIDYRAICCQRAQDTICPYRYDTHKVYLEIFEDTRGLLLVRTAPVPAATAELLCRLFICKIGRVCHIGFVVAEILRLCSEGTKSQLGLFWT